MSTTKNYLTETILSIHNEVQSALDYISTKAAEEGTELGKSTAILSIQNLRIKIPMKISLETRQDQLENSQKPLNINETEILSQAYTEQNIKPLSQVYTVQNLAQRQGFVIEDTVQMTSLASKIVVDLAPKEVLTSNQTTAQNESKDQAPITEAPKEAWGEIEITFSPIKRQ